MTVRISMWEAYLIETIHSKGMPNSEVLTHVKNGDSEALNSFDDTFDYGDLVEAYKKDSATIEEALLSGYKVKFVTKPGVKRLIGLKFGFEEGVDYQIIDDKFVNLRFNQDQLANFETMLSPNWQIIHKDNEDSDKHVVDVCLTIHQ